MGIFDSLYLAILGISTVTVVLLAAHSLHYWGRSGVTWFTGMLVGFGIWAGAQFFQTAVDDPGASLFWARVIYLGVATLAFFFILFVLEYTDNEDKITSTTVALLALHPVLVVIVVWTNPIHHLFWTSVVPSGTTPSGLEFGKGPLLWVHTLYSYGILLTCTTLLARLFVRSKSLYRGQVVGLLLALFVPWGTNMAYFAGITRYDLTSAGFVLAAGAMYWAMYRYDFIDLSPVARERVVDEMQEGMFVLDEENRFIDSNAAARRILGIEADSVVGRHASVVLSHVPELYDRYADVERTSDEVAYDTGEAVRHFHVEVSPLTNRRDETVGRLFVVRDVTERRRRERELERQNEQLEQFASLVSHDLRNPLNVADGYVEMIEAEGDPPVDEYARKAESSHDRMRRIIEDVLTMARNGQTIQETEPVDLRAVAEEAWRNVDTGSATLENGLDLTVRGDRSRLLQVFENLFRNAIDHGGTGVTIRTGSMDGTRAGGVVDPDQDGFFVEDDGPGIPEAEADAIFEAGYTTHRDGTGLGLSIVQQFVEAHGWSVSVTDGSAGGARFEITGTSTTEPTSATVAGIAD